MTPRERAQAIKAATDAEWSARLGGVNSGGGGRRLVVDRKPELIRNGEGEIVGVDVWVRLFDGEREVRIDPHRRIVNPPTVPRANVRTESRGGEDVRVVGEPDPAAAFWEVVWDSVTDTPNPAGWRTSGTVTTVFASTADGYIDSTNTSYSSARSGSNLDATSDSDFSVRCGQAPFSGDFIVYEAFESFDTSSIDDGDEVSDVELQLYMRFDSTDTDFTAEARESDWGASLTTADWVSGSNLSSLTLMATFDTSGLTTSAYNSFTAEGAFLTATNLKTGIVYLLLSSSRTRTGSEPSPSEFFRYSPAETSGTTEDPKLVITHQSPPMADAGPDQSVDEGVTVNLDGTGSTDPEDGQAGLSYEWTVLDDDGTGLTNGDISNRLTDSASFTAPEVVGADVNIVIQLEVEDSDGATDTDTVTITVSDTTLVAKTGAGGVVLGGQADVEFQTHVLVEKTGAGGIALGGDGSDEFQRHMLLEHTGSGGLVLGGNATERFGHVQVPSDIVVEWDFDNDGDFDEDEEDITEFVLALETQGGRDWPSQLTGRAGPGILRATLRNDDDRFAFFNTSSPLNAGDFSLRTGHKLRVRTTEASNPDPALLARDRFNRSDGSLGTAEVGGSWSGPLANDFAIDGNQAEASSEGDEHIAVLDVGAADYYAQVQLTEVGAETTNRTGSVVGLVYRYQDSNDYSLAVLDVDAAEIQLIDVVAGTPSEVSSAATEVYDDMTIGVLVEGSSVSMYVEGVPLISGTAIQTDETEVGIYADWGTDQPAPALDRFYVWDGLPAEVEGILWTGDVSDLIGDVEAGPYKVAKLEGRGFLSRPAGQKIDSPTTVTGRSTGFLVGQTLATVSLLHPPGPIDEGDVTTGSSGGGRGVSAVESARRFEEVEFGFLYETQEGNIGFDSRTARDGTSSAVTFSDTPGAQFGYSTIGPRDWRREVWNRVRAEVAPTVPTLESITRTTGEGTWDVDMPATVDAGDLLLAVMAAGSAEYDPPSGWEHLTNESPNLRSMPVFAKVAEGDEDGATVNFGTLTAGLVAGTYCAHVYRISNWFGSTDGVQASDAVAGDNPPTILPNWGPKASLVIAANAADDASVSGSEYPLGYTNGTSDSQAPSGDGFDSALQTAARTIVGTLEDPSSFSGLSGNTQSRAIAVRGFDGDPPGSGRVVQGDDVDSQDEHNSIRTHRNPATLFASQSDAGDYNDLVLARYADDRPILALSFWATKSATLRAQAVRRRVSDKITVVAENKSGLGINGDFFIESINHRWSQGITLWKTTWELSPAS